MNAKTNTGSNNEAGKEDTPETLLGKMAATAESLADSAKKMAGETQEATVFFFERPAVKSTVSGIGIVGAYFGAVVVGILAAGAGAAASDKMFGTSFRDPYKSLNDASKNNLDAIQQANRTTV